jgi:hypothetical protein
MNRKIQYISILVLLLVTVLGVWGIFTYSYKSTPKGAQIPSVEFATTTEISASSTAPQPSTPPAYPKYGEVILSLEQTARFEDVRITPVGQVLDSRCPIEARCIVAGTVIVPLSIQTKSSSTTVNIEIQKPLVIAGVQILFGSVLPDRHTTIIPKQSDYRFTFSVLKPTVSPSEKTVSKECFVGGCSNQLCTDKKDMPSTCEYSSSYACYLSAECKRQENGRCGWTDTPELRTCLKSSLNPSAAVIKLQ